MAGFAKVLPIKKTGQPFAIEEEIEIDQHADTVTDLRKRDCIMNASVAITVGEGVS